MVLDEKLYDHLNNKFEEVYAFRYNNVSGIDIFDERFDVMSIDQDTRDSRRLLRSDALVLKDEKPYLSVEQVKTSTPITVGGNILNHSIADFVTVNLKGKRKFPFSFDNPRFLLIVIDEPEAFDTNKEEQMHRMELFIKEKKFLQNTLLENFKISFMRDFKESIQELVRTK